MPNFSVLDGWWREAYDGTNGWAIGAEREYPNEAAQDEADALSLYAILENEIVPLYYRRNEAGIPEGWLKVMRASIMTVAPDYSFDRMLKQYLSKFYIPAGELGSRVYSDGCKAAAGAGRVGAPRAGRVAPGVDHRGRSGARRDDHGQAAGGRRRPCDPARFRPMTSRSSWCASAKANGRPVEAVALPMHRTGTQDGAVCYEATFDVPESGRFAYGVRARPQHHGPAQPVRGAPVDLGVNSSACEVNPA